MTMTVVSAVFGILFPLLLCERAASIIGEYGDKEVHREDASYEYYITSEDSQLNNFKNCPGEMGNQLTKAMMVWGGIQDSQFAEVRNYLGNRIASSAQFKGTSDPVFTGYTEEILASHENGNQATIVYACKDGNKPQDELVREMVLHAEQPFNPVHPLERTRLGSYVTRTMCASGRD